MTTIELRETRHLAVGDTLVSVSGSNYEVTKLVRVGRGIRVHYVDGEGTTGRFTAAPEAISRVLAGRGASAQHVA
ncbi:hypothetical protein [Agromyces cerinus]|uniref:DUF1918 domain-containing protein n=1 Tax=Agromyces cerinus subsp. cerinus TaxID=232089 RepID=A0A1N6HPV8_9MICO|nr:hypothetical protein [Agromyces cerinus]SIO21719.1 hypothetical protein SAMN05443544_3380 [Agromyces cerinus subsp. cerinus]